MLLDLVVFRKFCGLQPYSESLKGESVHSTKAKIGWTMKIQKNLTALFLKKISNLSASGERPKAIASYKRNKRRVSELSLFRLLNYKHWLLAKRPSVHSNEGGNYSPKCPEFDKIGQFFCSTFHLIASLSMSKRDFFASLRFKKKWSILLKSAKTTANVYFLEM